LEIDLLIETGEQLHLMEMKSGATIRSGYFDSLTRFKAQHPEISRINSWLVYAGDQSYRRQGTQVTSWRDLTRLFKEEDPATES